MSDVYVEVRCTSALVHDADPERWWGAVQEPGEGPWTGRSSGKRGDAGARAREGRLEDQRLLLKEVLALPHKRWTLLGEPGSGKTTLLHQLGIELVAAPAAPVPVFLRVPELVEGDGLRRLLQKRHPEAAEVLLQRVRQSEAVLLLDGLDEHLDRGVAEQVIRQLAAEAGACPVFLTSRLVGYQPPSTDFEELRLCPLDRAAQEQLLGRWAIDEVRIRQELDRMSRRPRLRRIAHNPMLLTLVGIVMQQGRKVPERRSQLYKLAVGYLLQGSHRQGMRRLVAPLLAAEALGVLGLALHGRESGGEGGEEDVARLAAMDRALRADADLHDRLRQHWASTEAFLADVAATTGLLSPMPSAQYVEGYAFPHRTVIEYLAASALETDIGVHGVGDVPREALDGAVRGVGAVDLPQAPGALGTVLVRARAAPAVWSEVLALTTGLVGRGTADRLVRRVAAEGSAELVQRVVAEAEEIGSDTVFAALGVQRGQDAWEARRDLLAELPELVGDAGVVMGLLWRFSRSTTHGADLFWARHYLQELAQGTCGTLTVPEEVRAEAGELAAGLFADHRPEARAEVLRWLSERWRPIPAGGFRMGSAEDEEGRLDREGPQHAVAVVSGYEMLSVPVTHGVYERFDPGHRSDRYPFEGCPPSEQDEHPVVNVSWYEACAFCAWLGEGVRLPSEVEWEYAARGGEQTRYWSGNEEADLQRVGWVRSNSGGRTHAVGEKPANGYGLHDVHGNVDEWCADKWDGEVYRKQASVEPFEYDPNVSLSAGSPGAFRVVRGGSWGSVPRGARSAFRDFRHPACRDLLQGFRLVRVARPPAGS